MTFPSLLQMVCLCCCSFGATIVDSFSTPASAFVLPAGVPQQQQQHYNLHNHLPPSRRLWMISKPKQSTRGSRVRMLLDATKNNEDTPTGDYYRAFAVLTSVPVAWGTFEVAVRYAYTTDPPIPPFLFSIAYYTVACAALSTTALVLSSISDESKTPTPLPLAGGFELGFYLFVGNLLQVVGLQTVSSDRAAFLLQLTTLFVPLAQQTFVDDRTDKPPISRTIWLACILALVGVGVMSLDGGGSAASSVSSMDDDLNVLFHWCTGDTLIVLAAASYTFHCLRLEGIAQKTSAVALGVSKALAETTYSILLTSVVVALAMFRGVPQGSSSSLLSYWTTTGQECINFVNGLGAIHDWDALYPLMLAIVWTGLVPVAYTITAQSYGQARVRPVTANLIYTLQPIFTALFAFGLLGENLGPNGYIGAALIGVSVLLVVTASSSVE